LKRPEASIAQPLLLHVPNYLSRCAADELLQWAQSGVQWHHEQINLFGRAVRVPRLVSWFGDAGVNYRYSGVAHVASGWPDALATLRRDLERDFALPSNFVLLNRYRSGRDSMGWHADDEVELEGSVLSVSLGSTRRLLLRCARQGPSVPLQLGHGTLLVHDRHYYHCLPKTQKPVAERINLTFRQLRCPHSSMPKCTQMHPNAPK
jgi:alkylated DNA repair dioxygenase AlkB